MFKKIPGDVQKDSGKCSKRFRALFKKISGNVQEDTGNLNLGLLCEILLVFIKLWD